jgi:hypothetical protein
MKQIPSSKRIYRYTSEDPQFWEAHLSALAVSGMTRQAYCQQQGISYGRFGYWKKRLTSIPDDNKTTERNTSLSSPAALLPVQLKSPQSSLPQQDARVLGTICLKMVVFCASTMNVHYIS